MIQIYFADNKDLIEEFKDFKDDEIYNILEYLRYGLKNNRVQIIKIRKWSKEK